MQSERVKKFGLRVLKEYGQVYNFSDLTAIQLVHLHYHSTARVTLKNT